MQADGILNMNKLYRVTIDKRNKQFLKLLLREKDLHFIKSKHINFLARKAISIPRIGQYSIVERRSSARVIRGFMRNGKSHDPYGSYTSNDTNMLNGRFFPDTISRINNTCGVYTFESLALFYKCKLSDLLI